MRSDRGEDALARTHALLMERYDAMPVLERVILRQEWTVVLGSDPRCNSMAINFTGKHAVTEYEPLESHTAMCSDMLGMPLCDVAKRCLPALSPFLRSLGVAALGAMSQPFLNKESLTGGGYRFVPSFRALIRPDDVVAVVGYGELVDGMRGSCAQLHVTEMRPPDHFYAISVGSEGTARIPPDVHVHPAEENREVLGSADVVLITASTLVNRTFDEVLRYASSARLVGMYGPTGSLLPDAFMEAGIDAMRLFEIDDSATFRKDAHAPGALERRLKQAQRSHCIVRERP
ncbi:MAG: DUF364 domain-containing protein [Candidatus Methanofastidiosa archaeon]|nr:DUF364 domain-containing protein [Candidatus Methanofastidiosa archaeon]